MRVHHALVHDERLPNRECADCETRFYSEEERKYCSESCRDESVSFEGEANPNYRGGKETTDCEICGEGFEYYPSEKPGLHCPSCVEGQNWRHRPDIKEALTPGGVLYVEHHLRSTDEAAAGPSSDRYRFAANELLNACLDLTVIHYQATTDVRDDGRPAPNARILARNTTGTRQSYPVVEDS
jgi:hypothetical protein